MTCILFSMILDLSLHSIIMTEDEKKDVLEPGDNTTTKSTKDFPLLLKNYENLMVRDSHYTPLANGSTPLGRSLKEYMRFLHYTFYNLFIKIVYACHFLLFQIWRH